MDSHSNSGLLKRVSPPRIVKPLRRHLLARPSIQRITFIPIPVEMWLSIYAYLENRDMRNLALTSRSVGMFAQSYLHARVRKIVVDVPTIFAKYLRSAFFASNAQRITSVTFSVGGSPNHAAPSVLKQWRHALPRLASLTSLTILGFHLPDDAVCDVLAGCPHTSLRTFRCESEAMTVASWGSVVLHQSLEELGCFYHIQNSILGHISPVDLPNLRVLDSALPFCHRLDASSKLTHLSLRFDMYDMSVAIYRINETVGKTLLSLRMVRYLLEEIWCADERQERPGRSDSPIMLCTDLHAPVLRDFQIEDIALEGFETLPPLGGGRATVDPLPCTWRKRDALTLKLNRLAWRPVWACCGATKGTAVQEFVKLAQRKLPVLYVAISLDAREEGAWKTFSRISEEPDVEFTPEVVWHAVKEGWWKTASVQ